MDGSVVVRNAASLAFRHHLRSHSIFLLSHAESCCVASQRSEVHVHRSTLWCDPSEPIPASPTAPRMPGKHRGGRQGQNIAGSRPPFGCSVSQSRDFGQVPWAWSWLILDRRVRASSASARGEHAATGFHGFLKSLLHRPESLNELE